jgi:hypothetical protein
MGEWLLFGNPGSFKVTPYRAEAVPSLLQKLYPLNAMPLRLLLVNCGREFSAYCTNKHPYVMQGAAWGRFS